jgi:predicted dehydrogenase
MSDDRRLTLGVIGAGAWAAFAHIPSFMRRPEIVPLIVNRRDPVQLEALRERFGFPQATTDWREVIAAKPDIVALTGPAHLRAEQAIAALEAGCHILAEKPFTVDPADAWAIHRLARERGRHLVLCYTWNEMGISAAAHRLIHEDGGIGEIEAVSVEMSTIVRDLLTAGATYLGDADVPLPRGETWSDPSISGGGYGQAQLTHALGLMLRLVPQLQPQRIAAFTSGPGATVELHDALVVRFEDGVIATIGGASLPPGSFGNEHQLVIRVTGDRGQVVLDMGARRVVRARGEELVEAELSAQDTLWSFDLVIDRLVDLVVGRTTDNPSPGDLGARVVEMLDGMYRSAASGQIETISRG